MNGTVVGSEMTEVHRHLLQFIMKELYMTKDELQEQLDLFKQHHEYDRVQAALRQQNQSYSRDESLADFIKTINGAISFMHFTIKNYRHPKKSVVYYGLANELDDEISKQATEFNPHEITLFRKILELIVAAEDEGTGVNVADLLNLRDKTMSINETNTFVTRLMSEGWLEKISGSVWFGPRALCDLRGYLQDQFDFDPLSK